MKIMFIILILGCLACTDAQKVRHVSGKIMCWSGGKLIYEGKSLGGIIYDSQVFLFKDASTGEYIKIRGDCVIIYN